MVIFSTGTLLLLYKKSGDRVVYLFFIFLQCIITSVNASYLESYEVLPMMATVVFIISGNFIGPTLIHFLLLFPRPLRNYHRLRIFLWIFYIITGVFMLFSSFQFITEWRNGSLFGPVFMKLNTTGIWTLNILFFLAAIITFIQFKTNKNTLVRNQVILLFIGIFFSLFLVIFLALFYQWLNELNNRVPFVFPMINTINRVILVACILVAILRFRIWNIEVVLKKVLLYLVATAVIILTNLLLLYLVDLFTLHETNATRFIVLAIAVIVFLMLRDRLQRLIDRVFHREVYDSATVVNDFEEKIAGTYRIEDLNSKIARGLDDIFHFKTFILNLRKEGLTYESTSSTGYDSQNNNSEFIIDKEFENRLIKAKVFSPGELEDQEILPVISGSELIVPLKKEDEPFGFFVCGPKKSERIYSMQDIRVLSLIARRVIALFHTAALYEKDLDRQLMLERERARISEDMHDDIGASLTRIALMSDMVKNRDDVGDGARKWLGYINESSRGIMEEMNQIIWALNPKNDNLEGLVAYIRRFAFEYLEPSKIRCTFDLPGDLPVRALSVEVRRNVYLVVREALHNAIKHSGATQIDLRLNVEDFGLKISIKDNGKGFEPDKLELHGNGLINMKKRMNDIGGKIDINSKPGEGTEIKLELNIP